MYRSRRQFLKTAAAATTFSIVPRHVLGGPNHTPPSEKVNIAVIGVGGQGFVNVKGLLQQADAQIVAVADPIASTDYSKFYYRVPAGREPVAAHINQENAKRAGDKTPLKCSEFIDYREMLDKLGKEIDAVLVATPDHLHSVAVMAALQLKKHTFCEKPLARSIGELRRLRAAAAAAGVSTQMGNQGHCGEGFAAAVEWMQSDAVGPVKEIFSWSNAKFGTTQDRPSEKVEVPKTIDNWDLWIGPAPYRDYNPCYAPFKWRGWWDFGGGALGDMGCHNLDQAFAAFDLEGPTRVECETKWLSKETTSPGNKVTYHCPAKGNRPAVKFVWLDGERINDVPAPELEEGRKLPGNGVLVRCEKGTILCDGWAGPPRLIPESAMTGFNRPPKTLPRVKGGHHRNWLDAIKDGKPALANFDYSARLTEFIMLGVLATRVGQTIEWDHDKMQVTNIATVNHLINPQFRDGWSL